MNRVNNKKNYQIPSKCKYFTRKSCRCKCEERKADQAKHHYRLDWCELCSPKVFTCKYFDKK